MFRYRLHSPDGDDLGEATYTILIKPGEEIHGNGGQRLRVLDVVPFEDLHRARDSHRVPDCRRAGLRNHYRRIVEGGPKSSQPRHSPGPVFRNDPEPLHGLK